MSDHLTIRFQAAALLNKTLMECVDPTIKLPIKRAPGSKIFNKTADGQVFHGAGIIMVDGDKVLAFRRRTDNTRNISTFDDIGARTFEGETPAQTAARSFIRKTNPNFWTSEFVVELLKVLMNQTFHYNKNGGYIVYVVFLADHPVLAEMMKEFIEIEPYTPIPQCGHVGVEKGRTIERTIMWVHISKMFLKCGGRLHVLRSMYFYHIKPNMTIVEWYNKISTNSKYFCRHHDKADEVKVISRQIENKIQTQEKRQTADTNLNWRVRSSTIGNKTFFRTSQRNINTNWRL